MIRVIIVAALFASVGFGRDYQPNEVEISIHRREVYRLARDYIVNTFNLQIVEESAFNPVRFDSYGVWGNFEARIKELGDDRFEVQGWVRATGHDSGRTRWTVHIRSEIIDPEGWRYRRIDRPAKAEPEILGWKFGYYRSIGYEAPYDPAFIARMSDRTRPESTAQ